MRSLNKTDTSRHRWGVITDGTLRVVSNGVCGNTVYTSDWAVVFSAQLVVL